MYLIYGNSNSEVKKKKKTVRVSGEFELSEFELSNVPLYINILFLNRSKAVFYWKCC